MKYTWLQKKVTLLFACGGSLVLYISYEKSENISVSTKLNSMDEDEKFETGSETRIYFLFNIKQKKYWL